MQKKDEQPGIGADTSMPSKEVWFESHGTRLFAVELGSGRPIIFLHGGLANHLVSLQFLAPLAPRFRLLTPDLRGSGRSVNAGALSWDLLADDIAALMRELGLERAVVGGISSGSGAALRFALRHPERTCGLVLATPVYGGEQQGLTEQQTATFRMMDSFGSRAPTEGVQVMRPLFQHLPPPIREKALAMVDGFDAASVAATTRFVASGVQPFAAPAGLRALTMPTLLVPGNDPLHPAEVSALYAQHLPRCTVREAQSMDLASAVGDFCDRTVVW